MTGFFNPFASGAGGGGGADYNNLTNKPTINGVTVQGSLTTGDLLITAADVGALPSGTKYGADFALSIDSQTFVVTTQLKDQDGNNLGQAKTIDLPLETMVVSGSYDDTTQKIILTLKNGQTVEFSVADLVSGLQSEITLSNKLDADLVSDVSSENKFVTAAEKATWNGKQNAISDLSTIRSGAAAGATALQQSDVTSTYSASGTAPVNGTAVNAAIETLDVSSVGGSGKYISAISETNGKISATPTTFDTSLSSSSTDGNAPTSKTVYDDQQRQEVEIGAVANRGAKNAADFNFGGVVQNVSVKPGTIVCIESNGTFSFSGTSDDKNYAAYVLKQFLLKAGTYKISGISGGSNTTYWMRIGTGATDTGLFNLYDAEREFNLASDTLITVQVVIYANQTVSNLVFKPMIRPASITDDTFIPYAKTNRELTVAEDEDRVVLVGLVDEVSQLKNYIGYEKSQILGLQADYQNKIFTRLGKAVDLNPGSDFNQFNIYNKRRRCNVSDDGTINAFYGESSYIEDGTNGQVMVYQPKFYYKVEPLKLEPIVDGEGYHIRKANYYISETPRDGFKLHPAFKDENGNELEYYLIGAYEASLYDVSESIYILDDAQVADFSIDKICSIANTKPISGLTQNLTRSNCEKLAINRGTRWHNMTIQIASAEQLLFMIEYGKMNAQEAIGKGVINKASGEGNESINTGSTSNLGNASGAASGTDGFVSIAYRGVENLWGNIWSWINGVNIWGDGTKKGGIPYITNKLPFVENTKTDYNSAGFTTSGTNGYISAMGYGNPDYDWVFFASETIGNSTLPVGDYQYYTTNLNGYRVAQLGGSWSAGISAGLFYWSSRNSSSDRHRIIGGRGVIIPDINATNYWANIRKAS